MHRLARYGMFFVVGVMLLVWLSALSLTHSVEEVQLHSRSTVRLDEQQCNQHIGPFAKQDTAWSRWREARGQGHAVSVGIDTCYDASGTKGYCFNILSDRKSTRLNSSHQIISYALFCLKKKKKLQIQLRYSAWHED